MGEQSPPLASLQALLVRARHTRKQGQENGGCVDLQGQRCVIKWAQTKPWAIVRSCLAALVCWLALGERVAPAAVRTGGIQTEALRLRQLRDAGRRVPPIWLQEDDSLMLGWVGDSLDTMVPKLAAADKIALLTRVADDLADWHLHGLWHGGAQLRNVTWYQDEIYRIDFEERHGWALSPTAARVYDLLLFLGDALSLLEADQAMVQGQMLLKRYLDRFTEADRKSIQQKLWRLVRVLRPLVWVDRVYPQITRRRDRQRVVRFARVVQTYLGTH